MIEIKKDGENWRIEINGKFFTNAETKWEAESVRDALNNPGIVRSCDAGNEYVIRAINARRR